MRWLMGWLVVACLMATSALAQGAPSSAPPPAPRKDVRYPLRKNPPPEGRILRLKPGQHVRATPVSRLPKVPVTRPVLKAPRGKTPTPKAPVAPQGSAAGKKTPAAPSTPTKIRR